MEKYSTHLRRPRVPIRGASAVRIAKAKGRLLHAAACLQLSWGRRQGRGSGVLLAGRGSPPSSSTVATRATSPGSPPTPASSRKPPHASLSVGTSGPAWCTAASAPPTWNDPPLAGACDPASLWPGATLPPSVWRGVVQHCRLQHGTAPPRRRATLFIIGPCQVRRHPDSIL